MKHGVLIIWHENFKQLKELILSFNDSFHIYVHVDRKALLTQKELSWLDSHLIDSNKFSKRTTESILTGIRKDISNKLIFCSILYNINIK